MKNYKQITKYQPEEWEDDKEWRAKRLQFIWDMGRVFSKEYLDNRLCDEKHDMYDIDQESCGLASKLDHLSKGVTSYVDNLDIEGKLNLYVELENMLGINDQFLKKWNLDRYIYLVEQYISDIDYYVYDYYGCSLKSYVRGDY